MSCWGGSSGCKCKGERPGSRQKPKKRHKRREGRTREEEDSLRAKLVACEQAGEHVWIRAALHPQGEDPIVVTGRMLCTIQYGARSTPEVHAAFWIVPAAVPAAVPAGSFQAGRPAVFQRRSSRVPARPWNGAGTLLERRWNGIGAEPDSARSIWRCGPAWLGRRCCCRGEPASRGPGLAAGQGGQPAAWPAAWPVTWCWLQLRRRCQCVCRCLGLRMCCCMCTPGLG